MKVAKNISDGIDFGRSLGGGGSIYIYIYIDIFFSLIIPQFIAVPSSWNKCIELRKIRIDHIKT